MTNIAILTGRLARDPEARTTQSATNVTGIRGRAEGLGSNLAWDRWGGGLAHVLPF
jgi:hypothetical protein